MDILPTGLCSAERNLMFYLTEHICPLLGRTYCFFLGKVLWSIPKDITSIIWHLCIVLAFYSTEQIIVDLLINCFSADGETRHWDVRINWPCKLMAVRNMNQYLLANRAQAFASCASVTIWAYLISCAHFPCACILPRGTASCLLGGPSSWHVEWSGHSHCPTPALFTQWRTVLHMIKSFICWLFKPKVQASFFTSLAKALQTWSTAIRFTNAF